MFLAFLIAFSVAINDGSLFRMCLFSMDFSIARPTKHTDCGVIKIGVKNTKSGTFCAAVEHVGFEGKITVLS